MNRVEFRVEQYRPDWGTWYGVVPIVNGVSLVELVGQYESARGFHMPGSYDGIWPARDDPHAYVRYLLGEIDPDTRQPSDGRTFLLGCNCSVLGCWPLEAHVSVEGETVKWDRFRQPHRPAQDYSGFGPFVFARDEYERAVEGLGVALATGAVQG